MLVLVVGDTHFTGKNPVGRLDDIVDAQYQKLIQIVEMSNKHNVPIIHTGDIFNTSIIANSILTRIGKILVKLKHPLYFVWGNHDLQYHSLELWDRTSLGVLWKHNDKVKHISEFFKDYKIKWAWYDWDSDKGIQWYGDRPDLLLSHKAVVTENRMGKGSWVVKDEDFCMNIDNNLELRGYRLIVCGHWHKPYTFRYNNQKVLNPGPVLRRTVQEWLMPSVVLLNTDTLIHKRMYLEAEPPDKVLSKKHIEQRIESYTEGVIKFVEQLKHVKVKSKKKFLVNLMNELDAHDIPKNVEKMLRDIVAYLIEKGQLDQS
jgi:DNA repair exonuclease SbcCD nuclease subunit